MGGDPDLTSSARMALACVEGGADLLGDRRPFSDPIADGPTIQLAAEAGAARTAPRPRDCLGGGRGRSRAGEPGAGGAHGLPQPHAGGRAWPRFLAGGALAAGVDALIIPDLLPEEAGEPRPPWRRAHGLAMVFLLAPTSDAGPRRRPRAVAATGFLYFVSVTGVTGARATLPADLAAKVSGGADGQPACRW
ncbi:MAG: tryptophan synthase subunit alpha [Desulfobacterales bacterium]|nr:tryptophan synthase subunit alpha [Desulfobacterales bacterium]